MQYRDCDRDRGHADQKTRVRSFGAGDMVTVKRDTVTVSVTVNILGSFFYVRRAKSTTRNHIMTDHIVPNEALIS